jgi:hypothetical protein
MTELAAALVASLGALAGAAIGAYGTLRVAKAQAAISRASMLFESRLKLYAALLPLTEYGPEDRPKELPLGEREALAGKLTVWYYKDGAGLLLSGKGLEHFREARAALAKRDAAPTEIWTALSELRTELKIDLGVREPEERLIPVPPV